MEGWRGKRRRTLKQKMKRKDGAGSTEAGGNCEEEGGKRRGVGGAAVDAEEYEGEITSFHRAMKVHNGRCAKLSLSVRTRILRQKHHLRLLHLLPRAGGAQTQDRLRRWRICFSRRVVRITVGILHPLLQSGPTMGAIWDAYVFYIGST